MQAQAATAGLDCLLYQPESSHFQSPEQDQPVWTWRPQQAAASSEEALENSGSHLVDSISDCRRTPSGEYRFQVSMYCHCCHGKTYWLSEKELGSINSLELQQQAAQAKQFLCEGLEILNRGGQGGPTAFICDIEEDNLPDLQPAP